MDCKDCNGACCRWLKMDYGRRDRDIEPWIKARGGLWLDGAYWLPHVCPKLKEGKCCIYEGRPLTCRVFKVSSADCLTARKLELYIEGIGKQDSA